MEDLGAVLDRVQAAGPPGWPIQGLWPADAYGVLAAEDKAGKTWAILDLAVSVAAGRPWLGAFSCPQPGRVLVFLGEGNQRAIIRRLRAICAHKHLQVEQLAARIGLCFRVPRLTSGADLAAVAGGTAAGLRRFARRRAAAAQQSRIGCAERTVCPPVRPRLLPVCCPTTWR